MRPVFLVLFLMVGFPAWSNGLAEGAALYAEYCIDCHGENAEGDDSAPDIQGASLVALKRAMKGLGVMPEFELTENEMEHLVCYLASFEAQL